MNDPQKISEDKTQLVSFSRLYSYFQKFLSSKISPLITKRVFLLANYDFLIGEINFKTLVYIASELGFRLNNFFDLWEKDPVLASLMLDLDELEEEELANFKNKNILSLQEKLIDYYKSSLQEEYHVRKEFVSKFQHELSKNKSISEIKDSFSSIVTKQKLSLGEIAALAKMVVTNIDKHYQLITADEKEKYFIQQLRNISDLITDWFLEIKEDHRFLIQILANIVLFPEKLGEITKKIIKEYFNNQISAPVAIKALLDLRQWAILTQDKKIIKATEPLKNLSIQSEQKVVKDLFSQCLKILEEEESYKIPRFEAI